MISRLRWIYRLLHPSWRTVHLDYRHSPSPRYSHAANNPHPELKWLIAKNTAQYTDLLTQAFKLKTAWSKFPTAFDRDNPAIAHWRNGYLPALDMIMLYTMIHEVRPRIYLEIGSGTSTKVARAAIKDWALPTKIICLDPAPRAEIRAVADEHIAYKLEEAELNIPDILEAGDILFVDNSHRILPNSDVTCFFLEILPRLKKGVIVHLHDIYLPYDYPEFMCERYYSEQYGLGINLLAQPDRYQTIMPMFWVSQEEGFSAQITLLLKDLSYAESHGGSYWLTIAEDPLKVKD